MGVVGRAGPKFMQTWTSAYLITYPAATDVPNHHESNQWDPSAAAAAAAASVSDRCWQFPHRKVFPLSAHTLQLCHIGLECSWGRNQGFVTPIRIHFSPPVCELLRLENKLSPLSSPISRAKHSCGASVTWRRGAKRRDGGGVVLTPRWQATGYWKADNRWAPSLWNLWCASGELLTLLRDEQAVGNYTKVWNSDRSSTNNNTADSQLSPCKTRNKSTLRTHLFSCSYSSFVSSNSLKHMRTEKSHRLQIFTAEITCSV